MQPWMIVPPASAWSQSFNVGRLKLQTRTAVMALHASLHGGVFQGPEDR